LEIGEFQNITVLVTKAKFEENNSHFLYFLDISNQKITLTTQEQKSCYIVLFMTAVTTGKLLYKTEVASKQKMDVGINGNITAGLALSLSLSILSERISKSKIKCTKL
jgi:hypothetical protein